MNWLQIVTAEIGHRWKTSMLMVTVVAAVTFGVTFFALDVQGYQKEVSRNVRDLGSNIVIVPSTLDPVEYYNQGGFSQAIMSQTLVQELLDDRMSLNHLIPILEKNVPVTADDLTTNARVVGIAKSIPMPGRPKAPMQEAIIRNKIQVGSAIAKQLKLERENAGAVTIAGKSFEIERVNRSTGTWQDAAILMDLGQAQLLFELPGKISRIEALECTDQECAATGKTSLAVLEEELGAVTKEAVLLRRQSMADARTRVRDLSVANSDLLQNVLWTLLAVSVACFALTNAIGRLSEVAILLSLGYGRLRIVTLFGGRIAVLSIFGSVAGCVLGSLFVAMWCTGLLISTGSKFSIDWGTSCWVGLIAVLVSILAGSLPAFWVVGKPPASLFGKDG